VKCTYEVNISTEVSGSEAVAQFLIDSAVPNGGGTDQNGFWGGWAWVFAYSVTSQVENASANQPHTIVVNLGCMAGSNDGCSAESLPTSLTIRVLKP
jgi:hypothetical protein